MVFPMCTTYRDIEPLMRMCKAMFKRSRTKIVYVVNGLNRFKVPCDFMEWFRGLAGDRTAVTLPSPRCSFRRARASNPLSSMTAGARSLRRPCR